MNSKTSSTNPSSRFNFINLLGPTTSTDTAPALEAQKGLPLTSKTPIIAATKTFIQAQANTKYFGLLTSTFYIAYRAISSLERAITLKQYKPISPPDDPTLSAADITVILPTDVENAYIFRRTIDSILECPVAKLIIITNHPEALSEVIGAFDDHRIEVLAMEEPGRRSVVMHMLLSATKTELVVVGRDDALWTPEMLEWLVAPLQEKDSRGVEERMSSLVPKSYKAMSEERIGAVATLGYVERSAESSKLWNSLIRSFVDKRNEDMLLDHDESMVAESVADILCLRASVLKDNAFLPRLLAHRWVGDKLPFGGSDKEFIGTWLANHDWRTKMQYSDECRVQFLVGNTWVGYKGVVGVGNNVQAIGRRQPQETEPFVTTDMVFDAFYSLAPDLILLVYYCIIATPAGQNFGVMNQSALGYLIAVYLCASYYAALLFLGDAVLSFILRPSFIVKGTIKEWSQRRQATCPLSKVPEGTKTTEQPPRPPRRKILSSLPRHPAFQSRLLISAIASLRTLPQTILASHIQITPPSSVPPNQQHQPPPTVQTPHYLLLTLPALLYCTSSVVLCYTLAHYPGIPFLILELAYIPFEHTLWFCIGCLVAFYLYGARKQDVGSGKRGERMRLRSRCFPYLVIILIADFSGRVPLAKFLVFLVLFGLFETSRAITEDYGLHPIVQVPAEEQTDEQPQEQKVGS